MPDFMTPDEVDQLLRLPAGKSKRLARRGVLPAVILPDGTIRFDAERLRKHLEAQQVKQDQQVRAGAA